MSKNKGPVLEFFRESKLALMREIKKDAVISTELMAHAAIVGRPLEYSEVLEDVAASLGIGVDSSFTEAELEDLENLLYNELVKKNKTVIKL